MSQSNQNLHEHPRNPNVTVFGVQLKPGDVIQPDDVYDSSSGRWETVPCPGLKIGEGISTIWVRPATAE
jgi:hypothetical protein